MHARTILGVIGVLAVALACTPAFEGQSVSTSARRHLTAISGDIGNRLAGSEGERRAMAYIEDAFSGMGYAVQRQEFSFGPESRQRGGRLESANVVAVKPGLSTRELIVGAHYDSEVEGRGAGDNASGVSLMLAAATALEDVETPYTIRFVAFGAEEQGLAGSRHFVSAMSAEDVSNTVAMINLDSLIVGEVAYVYGDEGDPGIVRDWILDRSRSEGVELTTQPGDHPEYPAGTTCDCSDHAPFVARGIPYAYFESTNWALGDKDGYVQVDPRFGEGGRVWHTPYDTIDYIDDTFPGRADERFEMFGRMLLLTLTEFTLEETSG